MERIPTGIIMTIFPVIHNSCSKIVFVVSIMFTLEVLKPSDKKSSFRCVAGIDIVKFWLWNQVV